MADRFEGFDPQGDLDYVAKLLGEGDAESLRVKLGVELHADVVEDPDEDEDWWGDSDLIGDNPMAPVDPGDQSAADTGLVQGVADGEPGGGAAAAVPPVQPPPVGRRDASSDRAYKPEGAGPVQGPAKPGVAEGKPARDPASRKLSAAEERERRTELWWGFRERAVFWQILAGTKERDQRIALGLIDYIDLTLVQQFHQSVPVRGQDWSDNQKQLAVQRLERKLDAVERYRLAPFRGWRGILSWLKGRKKTSAGIFYSAMIVTTEREPDKPFQDVWELCDILEEHIRDRV